MKINIVWGFREYKKPPTLVYPRPRIRVTRLDTNGKVVVEDERFDSSMNICLGNENHMDIFENLTNKNKIYEYNLT